MPSDKYALDPQTQILLADLGVNHENVLRRAGLPGDLLNRSSVALRSEEYHGFWSALEAEAGDPALPLLLMNAITVEAFNPVLFAVLCSADLRQAAQRLQTYKSLIGPMRLDIDSGTNTTTIACRWLDDQPPSSLAITELLFWVAMARIGTRADVQPVGIVTAAPPPDQGPYLDAFGLEIEAGSRHEITFAAVDAARPFLTVNDAMWEQFEPSLRTRLAEVDADASTTERVRAALLELLPAGRTGMRDVGRSLAMSTRTLQRRLAAEGTTFQAVLASTREALARHYLADDAISTTEISFLLGYADPSSFYRAFHDWTGLTPERARIGAA